MATALLLLPLTFCGARAADPDVDCKNAVTQMDMNICADKDFQKADAILNKDYKDATKDLDARTLDLLRKAQRAWIAFRDTECTYETAGSEGGSIQPMEYSLCLTRLTQMRSKELKTAGSD
jgi:uncharacterized protein YecT (DUF1311 family)